MQGLYRGYTTPKRLKVTYSTSRMLLVPNTKGKKEENNLDAIIES